VKSNKCKPDSLLFYNFTNRQGQPALCGHWPRL